MRKVYIIALSLFLAAITPQIIYAGEIDIYHNGASMEEKALEDENGDIYTCHWPCARNCLTAKWSGWLKTDVLISCFL